MKSTTILSVVFLAFGCREWEVRADHWNSSSVYVEPGCDTNCCEQLGYFWATSPAEVFPSGFESNQTFSEQNGGFPSNIDFTESAVLAVYLYACPSSGQTLRPRQLRERNGVVEGEVRQRGGAVFQVGARPTVYIETPADWADLPADLEFVQ